MTFQQKQQKQSKLSKKQTSLLPEALRIVTEHTQMPFRGGVSTLRSVSKSLRDLRTDKASKMKQLEQRLEYQQKIVQKIKQGLPDLLKEKLSQEMILCMKNKRISFEARPVRIPDHIRLRQYPRESCLLWNVGKSKYCPSYNDLNIYVKGKALITLLGQKKTQSEEDAIVSFNYNPSINYPHRIQISLNVGNTTCGPTSRQNFASVGKHNHYTLIQTDPRQRLNQNQKRIFDTMIEILTEACKTRNDRHAVPIHVSADMYRGGHYCRTIREPFHVQFIPDEKAKW